MSYHTLIFVSVYIQNHKNIHVKIHIYFSSSFLNIQYISTHLYIIIIHMKVLFH